MKVKSAAQLESLTAKDTTVTDVLGKLVQAVSDQSAQMQTAFDAQAKALKKISELTVSSKMQGPIAVTVEAPKHRPRQWVAVIERDHRALMSKVVITAE